MLVTLAIKKWRIFQNERKSYFNIHDIDEDSVPRVYLLPKECCNYVQNWMQINYSNFNELIDVLFHRSICANNDQTTNSGHVLIPQPLLLTWFNLNPSMDTNLHHYIHYLSIPNFHRTHYSACDYLSIPGLKLNHVSKMGSCSTNNEYQGTHTIPRLYDTRVCRWHNLLVLGSMWQ